MNRKLILLFIIASFFLVGCGASVSSTLHLDDTGQGTRTFLIDVSSEDQGKITGGMTALVEVIRKAMPEGFTLDDSKAQSDGEILLSISFNSFSEYKDLLKRIGGADLSASYTIEKGVFRHQFSFEEANDTFLMTKWAIDAVYNSGIVNQSYEDLYDIGSFKVVTPFFEKSSSYDLSINEEVEGRPQQVLYELTLDQDQEPSLYGDFIFSPAVIEFIGEEALLDYFKEQGLPLKKNPETDEGLLSYTGKIPLDHEMINVYQLEDSENATIFEQELILNLILDDTQLFEGVKPLEDTEFYLNPGKDYEARGYQMEDGRVRYSKWSGVFDIMNVLHHKVTIDEVAIDFTKKGTSYEGKGTIVLSGLRPADQERIKNHLETYLQELTVLEEGLTSEYEFIVTEDSITALSADSFIRTDLTGDPDLFKKRRQSEIMLNLTNLFDGSLPEEAIEVKVELDLGEVVNETYLAADSYYDMEEEEDGLVIRFSGLTLALAYQVQVNNWPALLMALGIGLLLLAGLGGGGYFIYKMRKKTS